jgi:hypothetical protein
VRMQGTDLPLYGMEIDVAAAAEEIRSIGKESDGRQVDLPAQPLLETGYKLGRGARKVCPQPAVLRLRFKGMACASVPHGIPVVACEPDDCDLVTSLGFKA